MKKVNSKKPSHEKKNIKSVGLPQGELDKKTSFDIIGILIIVMLGIIIYSNTYSCSFHLDDEHTIVDNNAIKDIFNIKAIWNNNHNRFIPYLSFAINYHFGKLDVTGYHLVNIIIHLMNACVVFMLTKLLFSTVVLKQSVIAQHKNSFALVTALLFVSHPLATQSVTYIVQRMASLVTLFYLLTVTLYVKGRITEMNNFSKFAWFSGSIIMAMLAMLSKENAITLPLAIIMIEIFFLQSKKTFSILKDYRIVVLSILFISIILFVAFKFSSGIFNPLPPDAITNFVEITPANYLFTQFSVLLKYLQMLLFPINQNIDYDVTLSTSFFEIKTLISFMVLAAILLLGVLLFNKSRIISFGIFWFFVTLAVESSIIPISDLIFEHRTYMPSYGFILILTTAIFTLLWQKNKNLALGIIGLIIISNSVLTYQRNKVWQDEITLWTDAIKKSPNKARPYVCRGNAYEELNKMDDAILDYNKAIELQPNYTLAFTNRGYAYKHKGNWQKAIQDYNKSISLNPLNALAYTNRGVIYGNLKQWDKAIEDYTAAIKVDHRFVLAYSNRAMAYATLKQWDNAIVDCSQAIAIDPYKSGAYVNRGVANQALGKIDNAIADFTKAIELSPRNVNYYINRGRIYIEQRDWNKAINDFTAALQLEPKNAKALKAREYAYQQLNTKTNF